MLVTRNVGLARTVAADIHAKLNDADRGLLSVSDLMQEGCAGLATAADKFDPQRGYRFSTYAFFWIKKAVIDCVGNSGRTIRLPIHVNENIQKMKKATRELKEIKVRDPTEDELADRLGWSVVKLRQMKVWARRCRWMRPPQRRRSVGGCRRCRRRGSVVERGDAELGL